MDSGLNSKLVVLGVQHALLEVLERRQRVDLPAEMGLRVVAAQGGITQYSGRGAKVLSPSRERE